MKRKVICWVCIRSAFKKIHLVDKFLLLFMSILLFQSTYNLFINIFTTTTEANNIDVIIRTSTAAIFGYFLSNNFIRHETSASSNRSDAKADTENSLKKQESFHIAGSSLQIIAASCIGIFCLIVLLVFRNSVGHISTAAVPSSTTATIAQFRDIVSGCVGFLIGCPTMKTNNKNQP